MPSQKLQTMFAITENGMFDLWRKSSPKKREKLCKKLGEWEAKLITEEIDQECEKIIKDRNLEIDNQSSSK